MNILRGLGLASTTIALAEIALSCDIAGSQAIKVCAPFLDYEGHPFLKVGSNSKQ